MLNFLLSLFKSTSKAAFNLRLRELSGFDTMQVSTIRILQFLIPSRYAYLMVFLIPMPFGYIYQTKTFTPKQDHPINMV